MRVVCSLVFFSSLLAACGTDLGECDVLAARQVVYTPTGEPYYVGQALMVQSCAGSFCHAAGAKGDARFGAPHGLDFDVATLSSASTPAAVRVLRKGITRIQDEVEELYAVVDSGEMPPGKAGERELPKWSKLDDTGKLVDGEVPDIHKSAGKDVFRNWLACGAPIIAGTKDAPKEAAQLGDLVDAASVGIDPTFNAIYEKILAGSCKTCHNGKLYQDMQALDFTTADKAFADMVGVDAFAAGKCGGESKLVVAGDCESSLLYQKVVGSGKAGAKLCGDPMPLLYPKLPQTAFDAICEWIDMGAMR